MIMRCSGGAAVVALTLTLASYSSLMAGEDDQESGDLLGANGAAQLVDRPNPKEIAPIPEAETPTVVPQRSERESLPLGPTVSEAPPVEMPEEIGEEETPSSLGLAKDEMVRIGGALGVILILLFGLRYLVRRLGGPLAGGRRPSGVVEVLARYPVGKGQSLVLMRLARRILVLHQASGSMSMLTEVSDPDEVANLISRLESGSRLADAAMFRRTLNSFEEQHDEAAGSSQEEWPRRQEGEAVVIDLTRKRPKARGGSRRERKVG